MPRQHVPYVQLWKLGESIRNRAGHVEINQQGQPLTEVVLVRVIGQEVKSDCRLMHMFASRLG